MPSKKDPSTKRKVAKKPGKATRKAVGEGGLEAQKVDPKAALSSQAFWVGFDLGGTKMLATVLSENYKVLGSARKSTNGSEGQAKGRNKIVKAIHEAMADAKVDPAGLRGIGIGCPGLVNPERGVLINAPNLGWNHLNFKTLLGNEFRVPVAVLNDVDAGTYGEYVLGAGVGARSVLGVFPGTGLGAGYVYKGELIEGRATSAMELGMIYVPGTSIGSEKPGAVMLEDLTSRLNLAAQGGVACYRGQSPELARKTGGNLRDIRSKALSASLRAGDEGTMVMFQNSVSYLGMSVAMVVNLLAPDRVVLGGGLVEELPSLYVNMLKEEVDRYALPQLADSVRYVVAKLGGAAVAVGSVAWLRHVSGK